MTPVSAGEDNVRLELIETLANKIQDLSFNFSTDDADKLDFLTGILKRVCKDS